jgi:hypothetical protein
VANLIRLPDGTQVKPSKVWEVRVIDETELTGGGFAPPRVVVRYGTKGFLVKYHPLKGGGLRLNSPGFPGRGQR